MKKLQLIGGLFLILVMVSTTGCARAVSSDQLTGLMNQITALNNSLNATQQELASAKQALQQLQTAASSIETQKYATQTVVATSAVTTTSLPVIAGFTTTPNIVPAGQSVTLQWNVTGATSVFISHGIGSVSSIGTRVIYPIATTTYTITATNRYESITSTATVVVEEYSYPYYPDDTQPCPQPYVPTIHNPRPFAPIIPSVPPIIHPRPALPIPPGTPPGIHNPRPFPPVPPGAPPTIHIQPITPVPPVSDNSTAPGVTILPTISLAR